MGRRGGASVYPNSRVKKQESPSASFALIDRSRLCRASARESCRPPHVGHERSTIGVCRGGKEGGLR